MENKIKNYHEKTGLFLFDKNLIFKNDLKIKKVNEDKIKSPQKKSLLENIPKNATHVMNGYFYKIGSHGYTFIFLNNNWQRCNDLILTSANKI